jgi:transcriptional regulator with XRE-family HTH domain
MTKPRYTPQFQCLLASLLEARRTSGLTQAEIAGRLDRPQSFVSKYETGERTLDVLEFLDVCNALGADPHELISRLASGERR